MKLWLFSSSYAGLSAFNAYLAMRSPFGLFGLTIAVGAGIAYTTVKSAKDFAHWSRAIKVFAVVPLGLGAVSALACTSKSWQKRHRRAYTAYINAAVLGNVGMMIFVPGQRTIRGLVSPLVCAMLALWLVLEAKAKDWQTVEYRDNLFVYNAAPLSWILHHACYRACLLTLPPFESSKYLLLEPLSLGIMGWLSWYNRCRLEEAFGHADTIAAASSAIVSSIFEVKYEPILELSDDVLDMVVVPVQVFVLVSGIMKLRKYVKGSF